MYSSYIERLKLFLIDCVSSKGYGIEKKNVAILKFAKNEF
jgi:hypothetical protein